jgi:hypothetical protein
MNPARVFGPMVWSGDYEHWYLYYLGEMFGAGAAALFVTYGPQSGKRHVRPSSSTATTTAAVNLPPELAKRLTMSNNLSFVQGNYSNSSSFTSPSQSMTVPDNV